MKLYRTEIDGLRALAIVPVILYHAGFDVFSGGFVGVDIFFVISGYLITTIILNEKAAGAFSLLYFYERRARRILPALFLMMAVSIPCAWIWLLPNELKDFSKSLMGVSVYVSNILFWLESGYFDSSSEFKPLLHTWSLAVEEQYYFIFPLYLMVMWRFATKLTLPFLLIIALLSFSLAQWGAYNKPVATFYLLPTRGWEIAIGAIVAYKILERNKFDNKIIINEIGGMIGLIFIIISILIYDKYTPFPSFYTLIPTIGTALIIYYANNLTIVGRILSMKIFVGVGLISYSLYLWHQPIFSFARQLKLEKLSATDTIYLISLTFIISYISWEYFEKKIRNKNYITSKKFVFIATILTLIFLTLGYSGYKNKGYRERFEIPTSVYESVKLNDIGKECFDVKDERENKELFCSIGHPKQNIDFLVFGDSHSLSAIPAFDNVAKKNNLKGAFVGASGCTPLLKTYALRVDQDTINCKLLNDKVYDFVKTNKISKVFLISRWTYYTNGGYKGDNFSYISKIPIDNKNKTTSREAFEYGLEQTLKAYSNISSKVFFVTQVPQQKTEPLTIYSQAAKFKEFHISKLSISRDEHDLLQSFVKELFISNRVNLIDLDDIFCTLESCTVGLNNISYYYDADHISIKGAGLIEEKITKVLLK